MTRSFISRTKLATAITSSALSFAVSLSMSFNVIASREISFSTTVSPPEYKKRGVTASGICMSENCFYKKSKVL